MTLGPVQGTKSTTSTWEIIMSSNREGLSKVLLGPSKKYFIDDQSFGTDSLERFWMVPNKLKQCDAKTELSIYVGQHDFYVKKFSGFAWYQGDVLMKIWPVWGTKSTTSTWEIIMSCNRVELSRSLLGPSNKFFYCWPVLQYRYSKIYLKKINNIRICKVYLYMNSWI